MSKLEYRECFVGERKIQSSHVKDKQHQEDSARLDKESCRMLLSDLKDVWSIYGDEPKTSCVKLHCSICRGAEETHKKHGASNRPYMHSAFNAVVHYLIEICGGRILIEHQLNSFRLLGRVKSSYASCLQKLNIHLLLERVFPNFPGYSLAVTQMQANATKRLHKFCNRSHFSKDAKRIYEKTYY
ncbi:hypothetical protein T265_00507 [Opisthorchis viverrini]|uniref:Uncharacterized protein n=1 Tax=Opisthorchis viverrini TaxID=6198 RepID=A0A075A2N8_OPIVI|nr:hypothetical protein T265_00507 [Opisthorchis viverrini]KER33616.1 hypothetical protein T265_00507 [Opisthorchis viverrini]